jgi:hypothetical protein
MSKLVKEVASIVSSKKWVGDWHLYLRHYKGASDYSFAMHDELTSDRVPYFTFAELGALLGTVLF